MHKKYLSHCTVVSTLHKRLSYEKNRLIHGNRAAMKKYSKSIDNELDIYIKILEYMNIQMVQQWKNIQFLIFTILYVFNHNLMLSYDKW